jgi:hypothetical protein
MVAVLYCIDISICEMEPSELPNRWYCKKSSYCCSCVGGCKDTRNVSTWVPNGVWRDEMMHGLGWG